MKNKKLLTSVVATFSLLLILVLCGILFQKIKERKISENRISTIPSFRLSKTNGTYFTNNNLTESMPVVFMFFNSECDFCINEVKSIKENMNSFDDTILIFASSEPKDVILSFEKQFFPEERKNLIILRDENNLLFKKFGLKGVPSTIIYDHEHSLLKLHKGQLVADGLLKILNN